MLKTVSLTALCAISACTSSPDEDDLDVCFPGAKCDSTDGNGGVAVTADRTANVLNGYNEITDRAMPACVHPLGNESYIAGQSSETLDVVYLANHNTVTTETSTTLGLGLDLGVLQLSALHELVRSASTDSTSINLIVRMSADYWVLNRRPLALEDWAAGKVATDMGPFVKVCGTHYANGVRHGAYVYALVTFKASSSSTIESIKNSLGLTVFSIVPLTPSLSQKVTTAAQQRSVSVTMRFAADGFMLDGRPASAPLLSTLLGSGIGPAFFATLDHVREQLELSVNGDKCRDGGIGTCDGLAAPGYAANTLRNSRPTGILLGDYNRLSDGVPPDTDALWDDMHARVERTQQHLRGLESLQDRIDAVYRGEIGKFLADTRPEFYQLMPPAKPVLRVSDLVAAANQWSQRFAPGGAARQPIHDAAQACYRASDTLSECAEMDPAPAVQAELDHYAASGRVLPVAFTIFVPSGIAAVDAASQCLPGSRLAYDTDARFVSPLIGSSYFSQDHRVWVQANRCSSSERPAFLADAGLNAAGPICGKVGGIFTNPDRFAVICVPYSGAVPTAPKL